VNGPLLTVSEDDTLRSDLTQSDARQCWGKIGLRGAKNWAGLDHSTPDMN
jgi:hypothetical protein